MRIILIISAALAVLLFFSQSWLTPPLELPVMNDADKLTHMRLSGPAHAGAATFGDDCAECHGILADGGAAPGLLDRTYALDFRDAPAFHKEARQYIAAHDVFLNAETEMTFNELELMAKFLRETREQLY